MEVTGRQQRRQKAQHEVILGWMFARRGLLGPDKMQAELFHPSPTSVLSCQTTLWRTASYSTSTLAEEAVALPKCAAQRSAITHRTIQCQQGMAASTVLLLLLLPAADGALLLLLPPPPPPACACGVSAVQVLVCSGLELTPGDGALEWITEPGPPRLLRCNVLAW